MKKIFLFSFFGVFWLVVIVGFIFPFGQARLSNNIIDKFIFVNETMEHTLEGIRERHEEALVRLKKRVEKEGNPQEGINTVKRAEELKRKTAEIFHEIERVKRDLQKTVGGGIDPHTNSIKEPRAEKELSKLMLGDAKDGLAYRVKQKLDAYVEYLNLQFVADKSLGFREDFKFEGLAKNNQDIAFYKNDAVEKNKDFAVFHFTDCPVVAAIALLTQKQHEVIRYEAETYKKLGLWDK